MVSVPCPLMVRLCRNGAAGAASSNSAACSAGTSAAGRARPFHLDRCAGSRCADAGQEYSRTAGPPQQVPTAVDLRRSDTL